MITTRRDVQAERPAAAQILERFQHLIKDPMLSAAHVRRRATAGSIGPPGEATLRSLYWRICLGVLSASPSVWPESLRRLRQSWTDLHDYLRAPDGTWVEGASNPQDWRGSTAPLPVYDPLGQEPGNPWPAWYEDLELRRIIKQDVDRTFPDNPYFRTKRVKDSLTNILFCFSKLHVDVSYRQGMHEILAIIFWCTDMDSVKKSEDSQDSDSLAYLTLSREYVEHDTYSLFNVLMTNMLSWYDPNLSVPSPVIAQTGYNDANGSPLVQPIVAKCTRIHELLKKVDFELWRRMEELKIEPQIYGIRWLRLLFSREFPMEHTLTLWDAMFAEDLHPPLHVVDYICLAMLVRIRESLLDADYSTFLHGLLRYPLPPDGNPRVLLLMQQAAYLRDNTTNFGGAYVRRQNQQMGAEAGVKSGTRAEEAMYDRPRSGTPLNNANRPATSTAALIDQGRSIAEGLYGRAEAMGINKAVFSALGDLKKSVQSYQAQQATSTLSEIPSSPFSQTEAARNRGADLARLRNENLAMGNALAASLRIIQAELEQPQDGQKPALAASLRTIEHVKDVLLTKAAHFDPKCADDLVGIASHDLLSLSTPSTLVPAVSTISLMDQTSPTLPSTATMQLPAKSAFQYPVAPPRTPSAQAAPIAPSPVRDNALPMPPAPTHNHQYMNTHDASSSTVFPDLGDWQSSLNSYSHPLSSNSSLPRAPPPTSRMLGGQEAFRSPSSLRGIASINGPRQKTESRSTQKPPVTDPLGALF